uniref:DNA repair protein RAD51 homolog 3 n=1 Tax=Arion vulgaris TaxID=1028688 RepID=A0A0B6YUW2_9EUPU
MMSGSGRELKTFPLKPTVLPKLICAGFNCVGDLIAIKPSELSTEANITPAEALDVLKTLFEDINAHVRKQVTPVSKSAFDLLQEEQDLRPIVTLSESLDDLMGGGVPLCKITEFCGAPGVGKTQMCMQLAVNTHIPECLGGLGGEVVYIDTEGSFIIERMIDIAEAAVQHSQVIAQQEGVGSTLMNNLTVDKILAGTHYYRCQDHIELVAVVHLLPKLLKQHNQVRLVIVDSIACPFRQNFEDMSVRNRLLTTLAQNLIKIATQFKVAVVLTNQMTTKIMSDIGTSHLIPALGESWGHASTIRIILFWEENKRKALLFKSPSRPEACCSFQVTMGGIRDVLQPDILPHNDTSSREQAAGGSSELISSNR